ncbi:MAG: nucleoside deaminase [Anaerolineae bacterium]|nr:nucleoside deaminase [Anaerolineae bacterium]
MELTAFDQHCFRRAVDLAEQAEGAGNLPIGAVISLDGIIIAEGRNAIWRPEPDPNRHAEVEALRALPAHHRTSARRMTLYTTLEPCLMCLGDILLHRIGRVLYGAADFYGGASRVFGHMPAYFEQEVARTQWFGPADAQHCDPLFARVMVLLEQNGEGWE